MGFLAGIAGTIVKKLGDSAIGGAVDAYKAKLAAGNDKEKIAADLAGRELAVQQREIEVQAQMKTAMQGRWYEPEKMFAYIMVIYFGKVIIWDKVLGSLTNGRTDPLTGDIAVWAGMIFTFWLGKRGFENVASILKRK